MNLAVEKHVPLVRSSIIDTTLYRNALVPLFKAKIKFLGEDGLRRAHCPLGVANKENRFVIY